MQQGVERVERRKNISAACTACRNAKVKVRFYHSPHSRQLWLNSHSVMVRNLAESVSKKETLTVNMRKDKIGAPLPVETTRQRSSAERVSCWTAYFNKSDAPMTMKQVSSWPCCAQTPRLAK